MTNPTIEQIYRHGSVRHYRPEPVPRDVVETIVAAGQRASTSSNLQSYSVVAVTDAGKRGRLQALCADQQHISQAPLFLAWCADRNLLDRVCRSLGYEQNTDYLESFLVSAVDVAIAMQNAALAAESLGLGICYIGAIRNNLQAVIDLLELPPLVVPISGMTVGRPAREPLIRPRLATDAILHWERYDPGGQDQQVADYDRAMIATGIYRGRQVAVPGRPGEMKDYGWSEHSARRVAKALRQELGDVIRRQGFGLK
jgi:nitroreductase